MITPLQDEDLSPEEMKALANERHEKRLATVQQQLDQVTLVRVSAGNSLVKCPDSEQGLP